MNNMDLLEITPEESLDFTRCEVDLQEVRATEENEINIPRHYYWMTNSRTFSKELLNQKEVASSASTLEEIESDIALFIEETDKIIANSKKDISKGQVTEAEKARKAQSSQKYTAPESMKIEYSNTAWDKIMTWVDITSEEISGLGCVKRKDDGSFYVYDVFLLIQDNTSSFTDIDDEALMKLMWEITEKDDADDGTRFNDLKYWWHSHSNMSTFWSGQDEKCIQEKLIHANWWLSTVHNKKNEIDTRFDIADPPTRFDDLKVSLKRQIPKSLTDFCKKEYEEKVTENHSRYTPPNTWNDYNQKKKFDYEKHYTQSRYAKNSTSSVVDKSRTKIEESKKKEETKEKIKEETQGGKFILTTLKTAKIVENVTLNPDLIEMEPTEAMSAYKNEIVLGKAHLKKVTDKAGVGGVVYGGLAYNPRVSSDNKDNIEWTIAGTIMSSSELIHCYILVIWSENPEIVSLGKITKLTHRTTDGLIEVNNSISIGPDKFINLSIKSSPDSVFLETIYGAEPCVGLIIQTEHKLPELTLGEGYVDLEAIDMELGIEEDDEEEADATEEPEPEELSLADEFRIYAKTQDEEKLKYRILTRIARTGQEELIDILIALALSIPDNADDQTLGDEAYMMSEIELQKRISVFVERDPARAFPYIWSALSYAFVCCNCFEPLIGHMKKCPHCESELE